MIVVYISGGLANKMFQYAFSLRLESEGYNIYYDLHTYKTEFNHEDVSLSDIFHNINMLVCHNTPFKLIGKRDLKSRVLRRFSFKYVFEKKFKYNESFIKRLKDDCCIDGLWQDSRYFISVSDKVRNAFQFPALQDANNIALAENLSLQNSVAIHLRKGDGYSSWNVFKNTCTKEYYDKSIEYISKRVQNPVYYVFTDCPELIPEFIELSDYVLVDWNPKQGHKNYLDMQLMSIAKHNIIANSTYSWWGAWLNFNPTKIVIAPNDWFNPSLNQKSSIVPDNWIKI